MGNRKIVGHRPGVRCQSGGTGLGSLKSVALFYEALDGDVARVESFYLRTLESLDARLLLMVDAVARDDRYAVGREVVLSPLPATAAAAPRVSKTRLREELMQLHLLCSLLKSFCEMNAMAVAKIVKKHDKSVGAALKSVYTGAAEKCSFWRTGPATADELRETVERLFADAFTGGDESAAGPLEGASIVLST